MADENTQTPAETGGESQQERTFTQSELDAILKDRLKRVEDKYTDYDELKSTVETLTAKEKERQEAELTELEKHKKRTEELELDLESERKKREEAEAFRKEWEEKESEKVEAAMKDLPDADKDLISKLPLSDRMAAVNRLTASKPGPGSWGKGITPGQITIESINEKRDKGDPSWRDDYAKFKGN